MVILVVWLFLMSEVPPVLRSSHRGEIFDFVWAHTRCDSTALRFDWRAGSVRIAHSRGHDCCDMYRGVPQGARINTSVNRGGDRFYRLRIDAPPCQHTPWHDCCDLYRRVPRRVQLCKVNLVILHGVASGVTLHGIARIHNL